MTVKVPKNKKPFDKAHVQKVQLTEETRKQLHQVYLQAAREIKEKLSQLPKNAKWNDLLAKVQMQNLLTDINALLAKFQDPKQKIIVEAAEKAGKIAVDFGNEQFAKVGLDIQKLYAYVPEREVQNIISCNVYKGKWSLSESIWKDLQRTQQDIQRIVAQGLAQNKSIQDISGDLQTYVDPNAFKTWDWSKVYPWATTNVEYNSQRLARTMIQHSYQGSMVQQQQYNPFCRGITWHSAGIHGRTCAICLDRDGQTFPVNDLPLDHPNGLCWFEPALDDMNTVADRVADWVLGADDYDMDMYVVHGLDYDGYTTAAQSEIDRIKRSYTNRLAG